MIGNIFDSDGAVRYGTCTTSEPVLEISLPGRGANRFCGRTSDCYAGLAGWRDDLARGPLLRHL